MEPLQPTSGQGPYTVGSTVVIPQPDQVAFPLTRDKFDLLQQGIVTDEKENRDVALGAFLGSVIGLLSLIGTDAIHWIRFSILLAIVLASGFCFVLFWRKSRKAASAPGYARVKREIDAHFG